MFIVFNMYILLSHFKRILTFKCNFNICSMITDFCITCTFFFINYINLIRSTHVYRYTENYPQAERNTCIRIICTRVIILPINQQFYNCSRNIRSFFILTRKILNEMYLIGPPVLFTCIYT